MKNQTNQVAQNKLQFKSVKNYFASLILVLGLLFSLTESGVAQSNCPTGWTQTSSTFAYVPPSGTISCVMEIEFCFICPNTSPSNNLEFRIDVWSPQNSDCYYTMKENFDDVKNKAVEHVKSIAASLCAVPPCDGTNYVNVVVSTPLCVSWYNVPFSEVTRAEACFETPYCVQTFKACMNYNSTPPRIYYVQPRLSITTTGTPNCSTTVPDLPPDGQNSACFRVPCN